MKQKNLHTHTLEKLFGPISIHIKKQNETVRIVELKDGENYCRTLAIVRFIDVHGKTLTEAYKTILGGELLGKTLLKFDIDFDKRYTGSLDIKLPDWLKKDFRSSHDIGIAFFSNIWVKDESVEIAKFVFAEVVEIIPQELQKDFKYKINPITHINAQIKNLFEQAKIELINV